MNTQSEDHETNVKKMHEINPALGNYCVMNVLMQCKLEVLVN